MNFTLRDIPSRKKIEAMAEKYKELDVDSVLTALEMLRVSREMMSMAEKFFASFQISLGKFSVLMLLFRHREEGGLSPSVLAEKAGVTKATITGLIDGLEKMKLITKTPKKNDRRSVEIRINENGVGFLNVILPEHYSRVSKLYANMEADEKSQFMALLNKISKNIEDLEHAQKT
jgi:DNA-binding MarR family transcriptional regulator